MIAAALLLAALVAQAPQSPPRDLPVAVQTPPAAEISGRVVSTDKQPLRRAIVRLSSATLLTPRVVRTDLEGRYTFANLPAGRFTLRVTKAGYLALDYGQRRPFEQGRRLELRAGEKLRGVDVTLPRAAAISGTILDDSGDPAGQMWVVAARSAFRDGRRQLVPAVTTVTDDIGQFRLAGLAPGEYYVVARERDGRVTDTADEPVGFETTFHPGTTVASDAQPVRVTLGEEVVSLNVSMIPARTAIITGRVVDPAGVPAGSMRVSLVESKASPVGIGGIVGGSMVSPSDGRFRIAGVRPGKWVIVASRPPDINGTLPVDIGPGETRDVTVVIGPGGTISGRVVDEEGAPLPAAAINATELQLVAPLDTQVITYRPVRPKADGAFEWASVSDSVLIRPSRLAEGFWLKSIVRGDTDISDSPLAITHGVAISNVTVVVGNRGATLTGAVSKDGNVEGDYTVILFPEDKKPEVALGRLARAERPDHKGTYRITGIPPGTWLVAAIDFVEEGQWLDPGYLQSLRSLATKITLDRGDDKTLNLELKR
jgi:Carboxypeptidase regulatory-like domain